MDVSKCSTFLMKTALGLIDSRIALSAALGSNVVVPDDEDEAALALAGAFGVCAGDDWLALPSPVEEEEHMVAAGATSNVSQSSLDARLLALEALEALEEETEAMTGMCEDVCL